MKISVRLKLIDIHHESKPAIISPKDLISLFLLIQVHMKVYLLLLPKNSSKVKYKYTSTNLKHPWEISHPES